jgi:long-chain fatty acid transport protein
MRRTRTLIAAALLLAAAPAAQSAGFMIYEHGAAAMAMAGAFTSLAKDPSALWHNPAGMAWLEGTRVMGGATFIVPSGSVDFPDFPGSPSYKQEPALFTPPNLYLTHQLSKKAVVGLGVFAPYGLGMTWPEPETFPWRYLGTSGEMQTFFINPAIAFKLTDRFALGLGVSFIYSKLEQSLTQRLPAPGGGPGLPAAPASVDVPSEADVDGTSFGFNAGLLYKGDKFRFGLNYRSRYTLDYAGAVSLDVPGYPAPFEGTGETSFRFPDLVTMGLSFDLTKKLVWSVDLHYVFWSIYKSYTFHFEVPGLGPGGTVLAEDLVVPTLWKDSFLFRTGFEYQTTDRLALRCGFVYDKTPQPATTMDSTLPDADRFALTGGFGHTFGRLTLDFAYQFENFRTRTSARPDLQGFEQATFKTRAHLFGINLGYRF